MKKYLRLIKNLVPKVFLTLGLITLCSGAFSQVVTVQGKVTSSDGEALLGVNVSVKGTNTGTITAIDGTYKLNVEGLSTLVFSYIGYKAAEVSVGNRSVINVELEPDLTALEELVVVGYGTQDKKDVTGSMATLKSDEFNQGTVVAPEELLRGRVAGVNIATASSAPGSGTNVRIRGGTSITASNEPLYVIDGYPIDNSPIDPGSPLSNSDNAPTNPLSMLNPADIVSIDVLKDASAAAIYGSRGANGVIIITTKQGTEGKMRVSYDGFFGVSNAINKLDLFSPDEYIEAVNEANPGSIDPETAARTDWMEEIMRTATTQSHTISVSGGTASSSYSASVGYFDQEGVVKNSGIERLTSRIRLDQQGLNNRLKVSLNLLGAFSDIMNLAQSVAGTVGNGGVINSAIKAPPSDPVFNEDGTLSTISLTTADNPVALLQIDDHTKTTRLLGNISISYEIYQGIEVEARVGGDRSVAKRNSFNPTLTRTGAEFGGRADIREKTLSSVLSEVFIKYDKELGDHKLSAIGGYSFQEFNDEAFGTTATGFPTDALSFHSLQLGNPSGFSANPPFSSRLQSRLISGIFRANYAFRNKYLLTATYRRDGSTKFSENNQWGNFPSVSVAWRLSEEGWLNNGFFDDLKLRLGWGITGSQEIPANRSLNTFGPQGNSFNAQIGEQLVTGLAQNNVGNDNLSWEETTSINLGLDFAFLEGRISGTLDIYRKTTDGLLLEAAIPAPTVVSTRLVNIGEVRNQGIELSLNTVNYVNGSFNWASSLNFAHNKNEIQRLANGNADVITGQLQGAGISGTTSQILRVGEELGTFYGLKFTGIDPETGVETFEDVDGDGVPDRQVIGGAQPHLTWGLNNTFTYKNWDLSVFFQGSLGADMLFVQRFELRSVGTTNTFRDYVDYWRPDNTDATLPALGEGRIFHNGILEDGSFLKLSNLTFGYNFPVSKIEWLGSARAYVTVQNAFIITDFSGFNPEVSVQPLGYGDNDQVPTIGIDSNGYPLARTWNFGLRLGF